MAAVVSRTRRRADGAGGRRAVAGGRNATGHAAVEHRAKLPLGLRLQRQHLVSLRANPQANAAFAGDVRAEDDVRTRASASWLRVRAAEPPVSAAWRSVGLRIRPRAVTARLLAHDAGTRLVAMDQEEPATVVFASGDVQSREGASHRARVAASCEPARLPGARRVFSAALGCRKTHVASNCCKVQSTIGIRRRL